MLAAKCSPNLFWIDYAASQPSSGDVGFRSSEIRNRKSEYKQWVVEHNSMSISNPVKTLV